MLHVTVLKMIGSYILL